MCGICGIYNYQYPIEREKSAMQTAIQRLKLRGPDSDGLWESDKVLLGHTRLSILDTSSASDQPFQEETGRYTLIFNGEIYNFASIKKTLEQKGHTFRTSGDTEVLLKGFIEWDLGILDHLNGFFAFVIHDQMTNRIVVARDRMGIKPLLYYNDGQHFIFASEMKALLAFPQIPHKINDQSLFFYLQLNYIPSPHCILDQVHKLPPGHYIEIKDNQFQGSKAWYSLPHPSIFDHQNAPSYKKAQQDLIQLMEESVQLRMISDVPLGVFLSGGMDSSVITALAARHNKQLQTFSIGFKDEPLFDETYYAELVAKKFQTQHTVFSLSNDDLFADLFATLDYIDEPFADPTALAMHILSRHTRKAVTVALSGDGGDELLAGYNKHLAEFRIRQGGMLVEGVKLGAPLWKLLPQSRANRMGNIVRQLHRFASGANNGEQNRYWQWASILPAQKALTLLKHKSSIDLHNYQIAKKTLLNGLHPNGDFNEVLYTDLQLVLVGDMLHKTDMMSMANGLEVRTPFLDHHLVEYVSALPSSYKINKKYKKRLLQDAFRPLLPTELYQRPKHGFDVPLLKWLQNELKSLLTAEYLSSKFIMEQNIFDNNAIQQLLKQLFSKNPADSALSVWSLLVFQHWYKKHLV